MKNNVIIRSEEKNEYREVENLVRESFWNVCRSGCLEHFVLYQLRNDPAFVPEFGCGALCFEGNIDFYGKSGFKEASEFGIRYHGLEDGEDASFFLCKELISGHLDGIIGEYTTPAGYMVDENEEEFDKTFPHN